MAGNLDPQSLVEFANAEITKFHNARIARLETVELRDVLKKKNPYLFRAKNIVGATDLVAAILDAFLSSSEEELFGTFLEELAIFVAAQCWNGKKSSAEGLDLEFDKEGSRYLVAIKSGPNWGNSSQWSKLGDNFRRAITVQKQSRSGQSVQAVLGICYGRNRFKDTGLYQIITGQMFWHFLSDDPLLYVKLIEPIGYDAKRHGDDFLKKREALQTRFTVEIAQDFCNSDYTVDWEKLIAFNSGNMTP